MRGLNAMRYLGVLLIAVLLQLAGWTYRAEAQSVGIGIDVSTPVFLIRMPFSISSGLSTVSGFISVYYHATRSVKVIGGPGQRYRADYSMVTYMFFAEYTSSLGGGAVTQSSQDIIYVSRIEATIQSLDVAAVAVVG